jgi:hypothetical protein
MEKIRIRDPGWEKLGSEINIPDSQHCLVHFLAPGFRYGSAVAIRIRIQESKINTDPCGSGSTSPLLWTTFSSLGPDWKHCVNLAFFRREDEDDSPGPQEIPQLDGGDTDDSEEEEEPADDSEDEDFVPSTSAARASTSRGRSDRTERSAKRSLARYHNHHVQILTVPPVLRIHDILMWIRIQIRGSMPLTNGSVSGSCYFCH